jgi:hypothetical protein
MGNENKINVELLEQSKSAFLPQEFQDPDAVTSFYSLEEEYARTSKNKSWILYLTIFVFLTLVIAGSIIYTLYLQSEGKNVTIDISDFEDVRLLDLVNESKDTENQIQQLKYELSEAELKHNEQLDRLYDEYVSRRDAVEAKEIDDAQRRAELSDVTSRYNRQVQGAKNEYEDTISEIQVKITKLESDLAEIKSSIGAKGQLARVALGSKDELHELQMQNMQKYYEDRIDKMNRDHQREINSLIFKFNPLFSSPTLKELINQRVRSYPLPQTLMSEVEDTLKSESAATDEQIAKIRKTTEDYIKLLDRLQRIPYQNSIPRSLLHSESLSKYSIQQYDLIVQKLVEQVRKKNNIISKYDYALSTKLRIDGENGFVLDTRNSARIPVYIDPAYSPSDDTIVYIFRNSEQITTARLYKSDIFYYIEPSNRTEAEEIKPLDNILLRVTRE